MIKKSLIDDDSLWNALCYLEQLKAPETVRSICSKLEVQETKLLQVLYFLKGLNLDYSLNETGDLKQIVPPKKRETIKFEFSIPEWIAFQSHFPAIDFYKSSASHETLINKLGEIERDNQDYDLFHAEEASSVSIESALNDLEDEQNLYDFDVKDIEKAILKKQMIKVKFIDERVSLFYPHRLVVLDGELSIISEDPNDFSLTYLTCEKISDLSLLDDSYEPRFTKPEVNSFISGMRNLNESEMRLVLKVFDPNIELEPPFQFIGKPYVALNWEGHRIWGVTIEPNEQLYQWLSELGNKVEIIDPPQFKEEYVAYLEKRLKNVA